MILLITLDKIFLKLATDNKNLIFGDIMAKFQPQTCPSYEVRLRTRRCPANSGRTGEPSGPARKSGNVHHVEYMLRQPGVQE
jgi:hypothetical protein